MRDIEKYREDYLANGFSLVHAKYRKKKVTEIIKRVNHKRIVEIGIGANPLFEVVDDYDQYFFFEPANGFFQDAMDIIGDRNIKGFHSLFYADEEVIEAKPDLIICSSCLYEQEEPEAMLRDIKKMATEETIIHINVPNARSLHRLLAMEMGLIDDLFVLSDRNKLLQSHMVFDLDLLQEMMEKEGFTVIERGSYYFRPFTYDQMAAMIEAGILDEATLDGFYGLSKYIPDYGSEIYVNCKLKL